MVSSKEPGRKRPEAQSAAPSTSSSGSVSANGSASMKTNPEWSIDAKKRSFNMFNAAYIYSNWLALRILIIVFFRIGLLVT